MENAAHTLCGLALARAGGDRLSALAAPTLVVAANLPDCDVVGAIWGGQPWYLCHHRGLTHALIGLFTLSLLLAGAVRILGEPLRRWLGDERPLSFRGLWAAAGIGLLSHLALDSLNVYGVRPFLPFSERWYYGDIAFIVDPWMWLGLGLGACLGAPRPAPLARDPQPDPQSEAELDAALVAARAAPPPPRAAAWWTLGNLFWWLATLGALGLLFSTERAPRAVAWIWCAGMLSVLAVRSLGLVPNERRRWAAWAGLALTALYLSGLATCQRRADAAARAAVAAIDPDPVTRSSTNPLPAVPWRFSAVVATERFAYRVPVDLLAGAPEPAGDPLPRRLDHPDLPRAAGTAQHTAWRCFARIPFVARQGDELILGDARFMPRAVRGWCNLAVQLDER
ncbi:MAG TPA: hypothetical protein DEA08_03920 [Planctomycetes bacterium]|nr:hypothetical protein [Planctomycetota bacterium]